jgi:hypothetical protein
VGQGARGDERVGAYQDVVFDDPAIHAVIEDCGGWPKVCRTELKELSYLQHRFCESAQGVHRPAARSTIRAGSMGDRSPDSEYDGLPELNFPAFHQAAATLRAAGYDAVNPAEINGDPKAKWEDCMRQDIAQLVTCQGIVLLPGWEKSRGATIEARLAADLGIHRMETPDV